MGHLIERGLSLNTQIYTEINEFAENKEGSKNMKTKYAIVILMLIIIILTGCSDKSKDKTYTGVIEATTVQVPALTGGKIVNFLKDTGEEIKKEELICVIDTEDLNYQLEQLQASLQEIQANRGMTQNTINQAGTDLKYLQQKQQRLNGLVENQATNQQSLDDVNNLVEKSKTAQTNATQTLKVLEANQGKLQAQMKMLQKKIRDASIKSPVSGIVSNKYYEAGEAVMPLAPVVEIIDLSEVEIKIYVSEAKIPQVKQGQTVKIKIDGVATPVQGKVEWISSKAEFTPKSVMTPETRASLVYAVKIKVSNPDRLLKKGMPVEVEL